MKEFKGWEKIFVNHIYDIGQIFKKCNKSKQDKYQTNNTRHKTKKDIKTAGEKTRSKIRYT